MDARLSNAAAKKAESVWLSEFDLAFTESFSFTGKVIRKGWSKSFKDPHSQESGEACHPAKSSPAFDQGSVKTPVFVGKRKDVRFPGGQKPGRCKFDQSQRSNGWSGVDMSSIIFLVSSFFRALGWRACRFHPTCSSYAQEAFQQESFLRASWLTVYRLLRCHPFSPGGYDPLHMSSPKVLVGDQT